MDEAPEGETFHGSYRMADGTRVQMQPGEAEALWKEIEANRAERIARLPDERAAIIAMHEAFERLKELGWREAIYCPKDGSWFDTIEPGSTGIFRTYYEGAWPSGRWWTEDGGDLWPSHPVLFRLDPEQERARKARMAEVAERYRREDTVSQSDPDQPRATEGRGG